MPEKVTLEFISEQLKRLQSGQSRLIEDVGDLKLRMTALEESTAAMAQSFASQSRRLDRIENRLDRIERRLDLVNAPAE